MNVIDALISGTPVILPIIFTVLASATTVTGIYVYWVNKQVDTARGAKHDHARKKRI
ncbi:hypothetical protein [Halomonas sp. 3F2F]|uniref:hypothetical protein n=1 Tax=Halomonas sp. 3F2F TaxID=1255602 RepID=UPI00186625C2|nr:hypothetical protein [Halomonas sp. 3F2F]